MSEETPPSDGLQTPETLVTTPVAVDFGTWLKDLRQKRGVSLEEIAAVTKIHISQLQHLEENRFEKLPSPAFVRGFIVCYAKHISFDENEILRRYKEVTQPEVKESGFPGFGNRAAVSTSNPKVKIVETPQIKHSPGSDPRPEAKIPLSGKHIAIGVVIVILFSTLAFLVSLGKKTSNTANTAAPTTQNTPENAAPATNPPATTTEASAQQNVGPQPVTTPNTVAPVTATAATPAPTTPPAPQGVAHTLELRGIKSSWINVRVDGKESQGFQLANGATQTFQSRKKIEISLSNAGVVELRWDGTWYAPPGYRGDVKSFVLPDQIKILAVKGKVPAKPAAVAPAAPKPAAPAVATPPPAQATPPAPAAPAPQQ
ncbi:MAG: DUF4115 domain-containing protein [Proteobacteria bacterium]|nr:DUF4115 domain-containing protein [Pseudomonadota bacterium]